MASAVKPTPPLAQQAAPPPEAAPPEAVLRASVLTRRADFLAANQGLRVSRPGFVLLVRAHGAELAGAGAISGAEPAQTLRFGITVTKRIGNAVVRNRMKRRFRALLREVLPTRGLAGHDHVLIGREGGIERDFAGLRAELLAALERARAGKGDARRGPRRPGGAAKGGANGHGGKGGAGKVSAGRGGAGRGGAGGPGAAPGPARGA